MNELRMPKAPIVKSAPLTPLQTIQRAGAAGVQRRYLYKPNWQFKLMTPEQRYEHLCELVRQGLIEVVSTPRGEKFVALKKETLLE